MRGGGAGGGGGGGGDAEGGRVGVRGDQVAGEAAEELEEEDARHSWKPLDSLERRAAGGWRDRIRCRRRGRGRGRGG